MPDPSPVVGEGWEEEVAEKGEFVAWCDILWHSRLLLSSWMALQNDGDDVSWRMESAGISQKFSSIRVILCRFAPFLDMD